MCINLDSTKMRMGRLAPYTYHILQASCSMKIRLGRLAPYMYHVLQPTYSTNMRMGRLDPYMFHVILQHDWEVARTNVSYVIKINAIRNSHCLSEFLFPSTRAVGWSHTCITRRTMSNSIYIAQSLLFPYNICLLCFLQFPVGLSPH